MGRQPLGPRCRSVHRHCHLERRDHRARALRRPQPGAHGAGQRRRGRTAVAAALDHRRPRGRTPAIGAWLWRELWSNTPTNAASFYAELVGYEFETTELGGAPYSVFTKDGRPRAGVVHAPPEIRPTWLPYVRVAAVDAIVAEAERLGARIFAHDGDMAIIVDPSGAPFGVQVWQPPAEAPVDAEKEVAK